MADESRDMLLRIIIEALNRTKGGIDAVAKETEKFRKDEEGKEETHQKKMVGIQKKATDEAAGYKHKADADEDRQKEQSSKEELRRLRTHLAEDVKLREAALKEATRRLQESLKAEKEHSDKVRSFILEVERDAEQQALERAKFARDLADFEIKEQDRVEAARQAFRQERAKDEKKLQEDISKSIKDVDKDVIESSHLRMKENLSVEKTVNRLGFAVRKMGDEVRKLNSGGDGPPSWISGIKKFMDDNSESVAKLDNQLRGLATLAVIGFAQQLITVVSALGGVLVSVAGSAAVAGAAIGAAMTTAAAQAVPAIGLIIAAFGRVGAVFDAVKQANKAGTSAATDATAAMEAQRNAANRVREASEGVIDADRRVVEARKGVTEAVRESRRELEELADAERAAQQAAEGALLTLDEARRAQRRSIAEGDIEGGARADLAVRQAETGLSQSVRDRDRTRADARSLRQQGVGGSEGVARATQQLQDAQRAADKARRSLKEAEHDAETAGAKTAAAATRLNNLLAQLSPAERKLYDALIRLQERYRAAFRPITDIIVGAFTRGVDSLTRLVGDPRIVRPFTALASSMAASMDRIRQALTSTESVRFFSMMTREAARSQKPIADIALNLFRLFQNIAEAGIPAFRLLVDWFERVTKAWADGTEDTDKLSKFFLMGARWAIDWFELAGAVIQLFAAMSGAGGAQTGTNIVHDFTNAIHRATNEINSNKESVRGFFEDSREILHQIGRVLAAAGRELIRSIDPAAVKALADILINILIPALGVLIRTMGDLSQAFAWIFSLPLVGTVAKWIAVLGIGSIVFQKMVGVIGLFTTAIRTTIGLLGTFAANMFIADAAGVTMAGSLAALAGPIAAVVAGVTAAVGFIVLLVKNFGAVKTVILVLLGPIGLVAGIIGLLLKKFGALDSVLSAVISPIRNFIRWLKRIPGLSEVFDFLDSAVDKVGGFLSKIKNLGGSQDKASSIQDKLSKATKNYRDAVNSTRNAVDRLRRAEDNLARKRLDVQQAAIDVRNAERELRAVRLRASRGQASPDEVKQAEINLKRARLDQKDANRDLKTEEGNLRRERVKSAEAIKRERRETGKLFRVLGEAVASGLIKKLKPLENFKMPDFVEFAQRREGGWSSANILASPGEVAVEPSGRSYVVPGSPVAADTVPMRVPQGTGILTWSGQMLRGMGMGLREAISNQLPHFRTGGYAGSGSGFGPVIDAMRRLGVTPTAGRTDHDKYTSSGNVSDHWYGRAVDFNRASMRQLDRANAWIKAHLGPAVKQLIWRNKDQYRGYDISDHMDHVHLALKDAYATSAARVSRLIGGGRGAPAAGGGAREAPTRTRRVPITGPLYRSVAASTARSVRGIEGVAQRSRSSGALGRFGSRVFENIRGFGTAARQDLAQRIRVGTRTITTGGGIRATDRARPGDRSLQSINRRFKKHFTGQPGETISRGMAAKLARWAGLPNWFPKIWRGESTLMPGIVNSSDGGIGLGQETPSSWGPNWRSTALGKKMMQLGGYEAMRNPLQQALMNRFHLTNAPSKVPNTRGFPWYGTRYLRRGGWTGPQRFQSGGVVGDVLGGLKGVGRTTSSFVGGALPRARDLSRAITNFFANLFGDGGFIDQFTASLETLRTEVASGIKRSTFQLSRTGRLLRRRLQPEQIAARELAQLQTEYELMIGERGLLSTGLRGARRALRLARRRGNSKAIGAATTVVQNILQRIADLDTGIGETVASIGEGTENALSTLIENINYAASHALASLDIRGRMLDLQGRIADLRESAGDTAGAFGLRGQVLGERGRILTQQRPVLLAQQRALQGAFQTAVSQGNTSAARDLYDQLGELSVAISENAVAISENTAAVKANVSAARAARVENITRRGGFLTGTFGGLVSLLEASASAGGGTLDLGRQKEIVQQTISALAGTGAGFRDELFRWLGVDLRGLSPEDLADRLRRLDFDLIERGLSVEDRNQFESLVGAIIDNATSVQQNTDQLKQLNSPTTQGFTSTAWSWFRNAIFNGAGGLLPQFQVPTAHAGAMITQSGLLIAESGEEIVPARVSSSNGSGNVEANVYVTELMQEFDPDTAAARLGHRLKHGSR